MDLFARERAVGVCHAGLYVSCSLLALHRKSEGTFPLGSEIPTHPDHPGWELFAGCRWESQLGLKPATIHRLNRDRPLLWLERPSGRKILHFDRSRGSRIG